MIRPMKSSQEESVKRVVPQMDPGDTSWVYPQIQVHRVTQDNDRFLAG